MHAYHLLVFPLILNGLTKIENHPRGLEYFLIREYSYKKEKHCVS